MAVALCAAPAVTASLTVQTAGVRMHAEAPSEGATIGDPISIVVSIDHPRTATVAWPDSTVDLGPFELAAIEPLGIQSRNDSVTTSTARILVRAFETGELTFPSLSIGVLAVDDTITVQTGELPLTVRSVGLEESSDIRGIKPPLSLPLNWLMVGIVLLGVAIASAAAWYLYNRYRRRQSPADLAIPGTPELPPHVVAYQALQALQDSDLLENEEIKRWYTEASAIIRVYIEARFDVAAMELPSSDILRCLEPFHLDYASLDQFRDFFGRADLVKFAKHRPTLDACRSLVDSARKLVDLTKDEGTTNGDAVSAETTTAAA